MDQQCNSKTLRGSLTVTFCIFKQTVCRTSRAIKSPQIDARVCIVPLVRCPVNNAAS